MKKAIFPGTFTIFHQGHIDVLKRALQVFDFVYVLVANNPTKEYTDIDKRFIDVRKTISDLNLKNVDVIKWDLNISDFAKKNSTYFIIRGIRDEKDLQFEKEIGKVYKQEFNKLDVIYFLADKSLENISSRKLVKKGKKEENNEK